MKKIKKVLALLVSLVMILAITTANIGAADNSSTESWSDKVSVVMGIKPEDNLKVTAYQIISYDDSDQCYKEVLTGSINKINGTETLDPTVDNIQALSTRLSELTTKFEFDSPSERTQKGYTLPALPSGVTASEVYSYKGLAPGAWLIIVSGSANYLYNPAVISVLIHPDGTTGGSLQLPSGWYQNAAYVKSSEPTVTKRALTANTDSVQYGDIIQFEITADIPSYTDIAMNTATPITYTLSDTLKGLAIINDAQHQVIATINSVALDIKDFITAPNGSSSLLLDLSSTSTLPETDGTSLSTDQIKRKLIKENRGKKLVLTYFAQVTDSSQLSVSKLTNDVTFTYSTNDGFEQKTAGTKHYTFGIDTGLNGAINKLTAEFIKTDENRTDTTPNGSVTYNSDKSTTKNDVTVSPGQALEGAKFELYINPIAPDNKFSSENGTIFTTDTTGRLQINGLDSDITYILKEIEAPSGYSINTTTVSMQIVPSYTVSGETKTLSSYEIKIDGSTVAQYTYNETDNTVSFAPDTTPTPYNFKNTPLGNLPSTGGIGTTIFTIGGCLLMIVAAALFFISRRKDPK